MPLWKMATVVWLYFGKGKYYWTYRFWEVIHVIDLILSFFCWEVSEASWMADMDGPKKLLRKTQEKPV